MEAQDVEIKMKSVGVMTQGIINVALPHIRHMWRKPAELSKKIEETANQNLKEIVRLLPVSYPLKREILGHSFHVGNMFQSQFDIAEEYCYWELSSVIIPTAVFAEFLEREEAREREREANKPGKPRLQNRRNRGGATDASAKSVSEELHPFSPANFLFPQPEVPKMTRHPAARGSEDHISYCLSEFTLNTWASSLYDLKLCEASLTDWEKVPGYLQVHRDFLPERAGYRPNTGEADCETGSDHRARWRGIEARRVDRGGCGTGVDVRYFRAESRQLRRRRRRRIRKPMENVPQNAPRAALAHHAQSRQRLRGQVFLRENRLQIYFRDGKQDQRA